jgi:hypothetical protein
LVEDCVNRDGFDCKKLGKRVAIDKRPTEEIETCWGWRFCDEYDSGIEEPEPIIEEEKTEEEPKKEPEPEVKKTTERKQGTLDIFIILGSM